MTASLEARELITALSRHKTAPLLMFLLNTSNYMLNHQQNTWTSEVEVEYIYKEYEYSHMFFREM